MNKIKFWYKNARPISLPQSLLPAMTAIALSYGGDEFSWIAAVASLVGVAMLHLAMNLLDDWFDYKEGSAEARLKVSNEGFRGRMVKYPYLTSGEATSGQLLGASAVFFGIALLMGIVVIAVRGWNILYWMAAAMIIGVSYSGGPLKLGFRGLGEAVIFIMFGPLMMSGIYYAVTGDFGWKILLLSTAVGLLVTNIVYSHSVLDSVPDMKMGKKTMAHLMGSEKGQIVFSAFLNVGPYLLVALGVALGILHWAYLAVLAVLPVSVWLVRSLDDFVMHREVPIEPKPWMGPMGDFDAYRKAGIDWFLLRWLTARNIVMMFCVVLIVVNFICG
jgi:1,4-dihydroxy-2-naphthoate octaprenyltransferase